MLRELKRRAAGDSLLERVDGFAGDLASLGPVRGHVSGSVLTSGRVSIHITLTLAVSERLRGVEGRGEREGKVAAFDSLRRHVAHHSQTQCDPRRRTASL